MTCWNMTCYSLTLCRPLLLLPSIVPSIRAAADEMVRQHHQLNGYEFEPTPGDSEGQGRLACCNPWGFKVIPDLGTEQQQWPALKPVFLLHKELPSSCYQKLPRDIKMMKERGKSVWVRRALFPKSALNPGSNRHWSWGFCPKAK